MAGVRDGWATLHCREDFVEDGCLMLRGGLYAVFLGWGESPVVEWKDIPVQYRAALVGTLDAYQLEQSKTRGWL
jgi:hypothetical protein